MTRRSKANGSGNNPTRFDIRDVALRAGVSVATVSRTINGVPTVNAELAARVTLAIEELNYLPNTQARALVSGRSRLIGLLVPDITNPFFPELIKQFEEAAVRRQYELLLGSTNYGTDLQHSLRRMIERHVDGVAVMTFGVEDPVMEELSSRNIPMVFMDVSREDFPQDRLMVDYGHGIRQAVEHLAGLGHREIALITGPLDQHSSILRRQAFLGAMEACGLKARTSMIVEGDHQLEGGVKAMTRLLMGKKRPTAAFCSNDLTAIGALRVLQQQGFRVPEDMSLIGFDDIHLAEFVTPPLTTVRMAREQVAEKAVRMLLDRMEDSSATGRSEMVATELVVRETTAAPTA